MRFFIDRPVATAMVFLALLATGVYSFLNTPIELAPKESYPKLDIVTSWYGVPPEVVQTQVTAPLEEACAAVKGVTKTTSTSEIGLSRITLEFDDRTDMEFATLALREEMAKARPLLPPRVRPYVQPYVPEDFRVRPFLSYTVSGRYGLQELQELVKEKLEIGLGAVRGVSDVEVSGGSEPEVRVTLDEDRVKALGLHPYTVNAAISARLGAYPTGRVRRGSREFLFKFEDRIDSLAELGGTIVASSGENPILVRDVAKVEIAYADIRAINRINGQPTVSLAVSKERGANTLRVARDVKRRLEAIRRELPPDLVFKSVDDESAEIRKNLNDLYLLAGIITAIVFVMVFVVLRRFKPSLLILSSIAFSIVITFNLIFAFKISLNMLTLGALALGFGMFVDNSIVVFENTLRLREGGMAPRQASIQGPKEVFVAVLASTLTTMAVFFSFPFFQGKLKIYYLPLALVIASAMAASLLVSFTLVPALSPRLLKDRKGPAGGPAREKKPSRFEKALGVLIRHPVEVLLVVAALLFGSYKWFRSEVTLGRWYSWYSKERLYVRVGMPPGTDIARTDETIRPFEDKVLAQGYEKEMQVYVAPESAYAIIEFPPEIERSYRPYALKEELIQLATQFAGIDISVSGFDPQYYASSMGAGTYYSSRIKFTGYNLKKLKEITADLERTLRRNPRIKEVRTVSSRYGWWRGDTVEDILKIDKAALRRYDVDPAYLYFALQTMIQGTFGQQARIRMEGKDIAVSVKYPDAATLDMRDLAESLIRTRGGEYLRLGEIAAFAETPIPGSIDRENQQFMQTIMWEFRGPSKAEERYRKAVFDSLHLPPGFAASLDEQWYVTEEEQKQINFAIAAALVIIFMILAALYESFVLPFFILLAVPLSLIGVFVAFIAAKEPFDPTAYIGVILLSGIVVNNAILLVDHIGLRRREGMGLREAVLRGTRDRVRPILMTTATTVFGMLPMLLIGAKANQRQIWSSLALCTVGGLTTSTLFILVVIPVLYYHGDGLRAWGAEKAREARDLFGKKPV
ncbi:MAG TPA: efflux RND transporter permease subunit [Candidatus Aminicenantes bacterium]|nr:efflux RND transporter permease subunit [Candidatus Aminicenantes bacterium]HRY63967.1 efflux RND transporter permease subunit [Candidatus Aminicenantes bacterium]HRZ70880.1 efflux RND transporter permease subunit [Candidatus Aminicenantes bacterium]